MLRAQQRLEAKVRGLDYYYFFFYCPMYPIPTGEEIKANCKTLRASRLLEKLGRQAPERVAETN